jgi:hypothetical protein
MWGRPCWCSCCCWKIKKYKNKIRCCSYKGRHLHQTLQNSYSYPVLMAGLYCTAIGRTTKWVYKRVYKRIYWCQKRLYINTLPKMNLD